MLLLRATLTLARHLHRPEPAQLWSRVKFNLHLPRCTMASTAQIPPPRRQRRSFAGPIVMIILGLGLLLANMGVLHWATLAFWFARYWPALIILWGVIKLVEYKQAQSEGLQARGIGAGGVVLLIALIIFGLSASQ